MQGNRVYNCALVISGGTMGEYFSIRWLNGRVRMLDQRLLPDEVVYRDFTHCSDVAEAIHDMIIRGAPAIGVAAAYGLALAALSSTATNTSTLNSEIKASAEELKKSRPTAVNLFWAIDRITSLIDSHSWLDVDELKEKILDEAQKIYAEDVQMDMQIAQNGQKFIPDRANLIHHCNTGGLATAGIGTALGVIRLAHELGKDVHVFIDETRPRLQGAQLTAWELKQLGIPHTLIVDGASGTIMRRNKIDGCLVGCDRIAANGDVANKIGTYNLALVAHSHGVPFYSIGPTTSIDPTIASGDEIPIEERSADEITHIGGHRIAPQGVVVANPAFDVTPARYITAIITERGVAFPPYSESLSKLMNS
jgi:methylthioribose-1-phosphate isomerase